MKALLKSLYACIPFKKELFMLIRAVYPSIPERLFRHFHFKGVFRVRVDAHHAFHIRHHGLEIENTIFWKGLRQGWERVSIKLWIDLTKRARVIFDIGANTGVYALTARAVNPEAAVYAFEPVKRVYDRLVANVRLNGYAVSCYDKAVSNRDGKAVIYDLPIDHILSVTVNRNLHPAGTEVIETEVQTMKLSTLIESEGLERIDLMKIDVETHEPEVLEGMGPYLARFKPVLLIEVLNDEVASRLAPMLEGLGYLYFNIDENKGITRAAKITTSDYFNFLICDHETAAALKLV